MENWLTPHTSHPIAFGVYDPAQQFRGDPILIDHIFVPWRNNDTREIQQGLQQSLQAQRFPMVSLEPWAWNWNNMTADTLFADVQSGKYDAALVAIFETIRAFAPQKIFLRWGHEMEIVGQYPWSKVDAAGYVAAYRHVVDLARRLEIPNILWVWSPAGNAGLEKYWVGNDYADYVGISIYAHRNWNVSEFRLRVPPFWKLMAEKYRRVKDYGKPVMVAEMGVDGTDSEKAQWLVDAIADFDRFPLLKAVLYFNQQQPWIIPLDIGFAHWELNTQQAELTLRQWEQFNHGRLSIANVSEFLTATP